MISKNYLSNIKIDKISSLYIKRIINLIHVGIFSLLRKFVDHSENYH